MPRFPPSSSRSAACIVYRGVAWCAGQRRDRRADGQDLQADRRRRAATSSIGPSGAGSSRSSPARCIVLGIAQRPAAAQARSTSRCGRSGPKLRLRRLAVRRRPRRDGRRQFLSWPFERHRELCQGQRHRHPGRGGGSDGDAICMAGDKVVRCTEGLIYYTGYAIPVLIAIAVGVAMTFIADAHRVRPLCLRHRRQSGGGRARRHQHQAD